MLLGSIFRIRCMNSLTSILPSRLGSHSLVLKLITFRFLIFCRQQRELQFFKDFVSMPASKSAHQFWDSGTSLESLCNQFLLVVA